MNDTDSSQQFVDNAELAAKHELPYQASDQRCDHQRREDERADSFESAVLVRQHDRKNQSEHRLQDTGDEHVRKSMAGIGEECIRGECADIVPQANERAMIVFVTTAEETVIHEFEQREQQERCHEDSRRQEEQNQRSGSERGTNHSSRARFGVIVLVCHDVFRFPHRVLAQDAFHFFLRLCEFSFGVAVFQDLLHKRRKHFGLDFRPCSNRRTVLRLR